MIKILASYQRPAATESTAISFSRWVHKKKNVFILTLHESNTQKVKHGETQEQRSLGKNST